MTPVTWGVPRRTGFAFAGLTLWLLALAMLRPMSIDESQYVAASVLTAKGLLPYRDYAYLQTPLQPFAFAPLAWLFPGHLLVATRVANVLLGSATIMLVYATARAAGAGSRASLSGAAMLAACESFIWSTGVARNDLLPAVLMMIGLWALARHPGGWSGLAAGAAFGFAASAKISYAVPAATVFLAGVWTRDAGERRRFIAFAAGVAVGLLPTVALAAIAPQPFFVEAIVFPAKGPTQYYNEIGKAWRLGIGRFGRLLISAAVGPALIAGIEVARSSWIDPRTWLGDPVRRTMLAAMVGGLVSAGLNKPFHIFYLLPALPPLFVLTALLLQEDEQRPRSLKAAWALSIAAILVPVTAWSVRAWNHGIAPGPDAERRSAVLGAALRPQRVEGPIATLAGQYVPDAGAEIDRRFASGPFLYRTSGLVSDRQAREWHVVTRDRSGDLLEAPPGAFVTGDYPDVQPAQELELATQARALGYRPVAEASGFIIWKR